jgi:hypothetical protein
MGNRDRLLATGTAEGLVSAVLLPQLCHLCRTRQQGVDIAFANGAPGKQWHSAKRSPRHGAATGRASEQPSCCRRPRSIPHSLTGFPRFSSTQFQRGRATRPVIQRRSRATSQKP